MISEIIRSNALISSLVIKQIRTKTDPWAIAPTKTTTEWVSGILGRYLLSFVGSASKESAVLVISPRDSEERGKTYWFYASLLGGDLLLGSSGNKLVGRHSVIWRRSTLITFNSFSEPLTDRIESLCNSCTVQGQQLQPYTRQSRRSHEPINPLNLLNVLGILTLGFTSIRTPLAVWM